jgi:serine/threonine-protein phosphatase 6 regulatory ankyrin repeat subunit B
MFCHVPECQGRTISSLLSIAFAFINSQVIDCSAFIMFDQLPDELVIQIAKSLNRHDLNSLIRTIHRFARILNPLLDAFVNHTFKDRRTPLQWAAFKGSAALTQSLLGRGADIALQDWHGDTALHFAARGGNVDSVKVLLQNGANIAQTNFYYSTALHHASLCNHADVVSLLLDSGADVSRPLYRTVLHRAVRGGHENLARFLLQAGADVSAEGPVEGMRIEAHDIPEAHHHFCDPNAEGAIDIIPGRLVDGPSPVTSLYYAVLEGHETITQLLIEYGIRISPRDHNLKTALQFAIRRGSSRHLMVSRMLIVTRPDAFVEIPGKWGLTSIHWAASRGYVDLVRLLLRRDSRTINGSETDGSGHVPLIEATKNGHGAVVKLFLEAGADPSTEDGKGQSALLWATKYGRLSVVKLLLDAGADHKAERNFSEMPLFVAAKEGHIELVRFLLQVDSNINLSQMTSSGQSIIHQPANRGYDHIVQLFLNAGVDASINNGYGSPLHKAATGRKNVTTIRLLLDAGSDISIKDENGNTPLEAAILAGNESVFTTLLEASSGICIHTGYRKPLLHTAAAAGRDTMVNLLLNIGGDVHLRDEFGTPLHWAARRGDAKSIKLLVEAGADSTAKDSAGKTALYWASHRGVAASVLLLLQEGVKQRGRVEWE